MNQITFEERNDKIAIELLCDNILDQKTIDENLKLTDKSSGLSLEKVLVKKGLITEMQAASLLANAAKLMCCDVESIVISDKALNTVNIDTCLKYNCLPLAFDELDNDVLLIAMSDIPDDEMITELENVSGYKVRPLLASYTVISEKLKEKYL